MEIYLGKVACKNPNQIGGTSEVFINKQGRKISWFYSDKLKQLPPSKPDDDPDIDDDAVTDEEDPESQDSHGWLETGHPHFQEEPKTDKSGPSDHRGKKLAGGSKAVQEYSHDCEVLLGFSDVFQEINDLAINLTKQNTEGAVLTDTCEENRNDSADDVILTSGEAALKLSENLGLTDLPTAVLEVDVSQKKGEMSEIELLVHEKNTPVMNETMSYAQATSKRSVSKPVDLAEDTCQLDIELEVKPTKRISNLLCKTRRSARIKDTEVDMQEKATARKALAKGISAPPIPPSCPNPPCALDSLAKTCGFSLGNDDSTRTANISLIQAKEDALAAIQSTKKKLSSIAESSNGDVPRDMPVIERSGLQHQNVLEAGENKDNIVPNLLIADQG